MTRLWPTRLLTIQARAQRLIAEAYFAGEASVTIALDSGRREEVSGLLAPSRQTVTADLPLRATAKYSSKSK